MKIYSEELCSTLKAGWFELLCANLFGKKYSIKDEGYTVRFAKWRGKVYFLDFE